MSIETPTPSMASEKHESKSKSDKKHKSSSHGEKKRKRDHKEDGHKSKSKKLKSEDHTTTEEPSTISPFHIQTSSLYLPLAPISQRYPLEGLCAEHLSPLILTYYPPFAGVVLSYHNPRLSERPYGDDGAENVLLQNIDEYAVSWAWVTAEFLLFKPEKGAWLEGYVNLQNEGHLGIVCWNLFNASIERKRLPAEWKWVGVEDAREGDEGEGEVYAEEGAGYWADKEGKKIEGMVKFRVREIESSHDRERGFLSIEGTMLGEDAEAELVQSEKDGVLQNRDTAGRRLGGMKALGATSLGVPVESDIMDSEAGKKKSRHKY